jgi:hypothetical protein
LGGNHERQFFDQIPDDFKGSRTRAHDDPRVSTPKMQTV